MRKIRKSVFETNSSAVHCLVVPNNLLQSSELKINKNGMIEVGFITDNTEYPLDTQYKKLSYLITQIYYSSGCWCNDKKLEENYEFYIIQEYICEYTGAKGIVINYQNEPCINHQAVWDSEAERFIDIYDKVALISFVFGPMMVKEYMD